MFGIVALSNARYLGGRATDLGSGNGATNNNGSICIFAPIEICRSGHRENWSGEERGE